MAGCAGGGHAALPTPTPSCEVADGVAKGTVADYPDRPFLLSAAGSSAPGRPLVVALHGSGGSPQQMEAMTHLAARGAVAGVNVVLPSAADGIWNNFSVNDEPYLDGVIDTALKRTCADPRAVVLAGFSNGGDEAQTIGCVEAARWRAVVVVSSSTVPDRCVHGGPPVTLLRVHGLLDRVSPFEGRDGDDPRDPVLPATARWATYDGCAATPAETGTTRRWSGCAAGTSVQLLALPSVGHAWPEQPDVTGLVLALALGRKAPSG